MPSIYIYKYNNYYNKNHRYTYKELEDYITQLEEELSYERKRNKSLEHIRSYDSRPWPRS